jgi:DNA mismatch endonuclease, patch repair protein
MARSKEIVSYNMSRIRSQGTYLELKLEEILKSLNCSYEKHPGIYGKPDFAYLKQKIAIFADSDFWHGYSWESKKLELKTNKKFWLKKIERNMARDVEVTDHLQQQGWIVIRFWGHDILKKPGDCKGVLTQALQESESKSSID